MSYATDLAKYLTAAYTVDASPNDGGANPAKYIPLDSSWHDVNRTVHNAVEDAHLTDGATGGDRNAEVFLELDRNVISDLDSGKIRTVDLLPYLSIAAIRVDLFGDVIITFTTRDRLVFG